MKKIISEKDFSLEVDYIDKRPILRINLSGQFIEVELSLIEKLRRQEAEERGIE